MINFEQQVVLVTGASRGIGQAICQHFLNTGATIIGTATTEQGAARITDNLQGQGKGMVLNLESKDSIESLIKNILAEYQRIDILVNNAGITEDNLIVRISDEQWEKVINTNLSAIFKISKAVMRPMMKQKFGRIINIGSVVGSIGNPGQTNYCAAKAGVIGFSKALAKEVATRGITINSIAPGFIETDMTLQLTEEQRTKITSQIPTNKLGSVDDIAYAVLFLASHYAAYITGETLHVNGGMYMP